MFDIGAFHVDGDIVLVNTDAFERWDDFGGPAAKAGHEINTVTRIVATGSTSKQVAADLGITTKTVSHHIEHVYDKIGVRSRAGATLFAIKLGLA